MKEPMLQDYRQDAMKIIWETDGVDHDPVILWGDNLENRVTNIRSTWINEEHIVHVGVIEGLEPVKKFSIKFRFKISNPLCFEQVLKKVTIFPLSGLETIKKPTTDSPSTSAILPPKNPICSSSLGICFSSGLDFGSGTLCGGNHCRQPTWHKRHRS